MQRCLQLAKNGLGQTYPNPLVGCVIVKDENIIGEGWHQKAGQPHAEVNAIKSVQEESQLKKAILYVNLEPCSHYGKTPPCSDLIIEKGIKRVVIGNVDPNPKVAGGGVKKLRNAGVEVEAGCLNDQCWEINKRFFTVQEKSRPYVILKWAQTRDGFIAPKQQETGKPTWITNSYSKQLVHKWRTGEQAILVGKNTAIKDDPQLNARLWEGSNPVRVVIDRELKSFKGNIGLHLFDKQVKTIVLCENPQENQQNLWFKKVNFEEEVIPQILAILNECGLQSVIIEGGQKTLQRFIDAGFWDEARVFTGDSYFGTGICAPFFKANPNKTLYFEEDELKLYRND